MRGFYIYNGCLLAILIAFVSGFGTYMVMDQKALKRSYRPVLVVNESGIACYSHRDALACVYVPQEAK